MEKSKMSLKNNYINICTFNSNGLKRNLHYLEFLTLNDIIFLSETWLVDNEDKVIIKPLCPTHSIFHKADLVAYPSIGRAYGGRAFLVNKSIKVITVSWINDHIGLITIEMGTNLITIIGVYLPYDNNTHENISEFINCLLLLNELKDIYVKQNHMVCICGDFNADYRRGNRFDNKLQEFIDLSGALLPLSNNYSTLSYKKGMYTSLIDHFLVYNINENNCKSWIVDDIENLSDHLPVFLELKLNFQSSIGHLRQIDMTLLKIKPNLDKPEIKLKYQEKINLHMEVITNNTWRSDNKILMVNEMYRQVTQAIKRAYEECCTLIPKHKYDEQFAIFTPELRELKRRIVKLRLKQVRTDNEETQLKYFKQQFKSLIKKRRKEYEQGIFKKTENLIKIKNGEKFFKKVNDMKGRSPININIDILADEYSKIFNFKAETDHNLNRRVSDTIAITKDLEKCEIKVTKAEIMLAISQMEQSNVCGDDGISTNMLTNCPEEFLNKYIVFLFKFIFKHNIIPDNMNVTHIVPIIKDTKKNNDDINNLRPISISNVLAQVFERILLNKLPELYKTSENQFGYKKNTSCTHALFAFKETICHFNSKGKECYAVSLDAVKAFDRIWRDALWYKMVIRGIDPHMVRLLMQYYEKHVGKVRLNDKISSSFGISAGVKQGGVISPFLFNFFIDDLIRECTQSGLGAKIKNLMLNIFGFCDDISLLSTCCKDMQQLLNICGNYANKWGIQFNVAKCFFMVFGTKRHDDQLFMLNGETIPLCETFKYLGVEFNYRMNFSSFFREKFEKVRKSFFSLNFLGFRPGGINPFTQVRIYKSFCLSKFLYGLEIFNLTKSSANKINIAQNSIIRYMLGLPKRSHMSDVLSILQIFPISYLNTYMKLIFLKNIKNSELCMNLFENLKLNRYSKSSPSIFKEWHSIAYRYFGTSLTEIYGKIKEITKQFKTDYKVNEMNTQLELIACCIRQSYDYKMRDQLKIITRVDSLT